VPCDAAVSRARARARAPQRARGGRRRADARGPRARCAQISSFVVQQMELVHRSFFAARGAIPRGALCEVAFADLERDTPSEIRRVYASLRIASSPAQVPPPPRPAAVRPRPR